jgi:NAD(P)-dependent dehydrogenase (short-subunit alcohol dehydrogenase family)
MRSRVRAEKIVEMARVRAEGFGMEVRGEVALVTGAAVGIGRAIAVRLAVDGATVALADIDVQGGEQTRAIIEERGGQAWFMRADMRVPADVENLVATVANEFAGSPGVLVNNAGGGGHLEPNFPDASAAQWGALIDLNLRSAMQATQLVLAPMRHRGGGAIINVSSTAGLGLRPYNSPEYAAAKAGLIRFTAALATLRERMNIRINCVVPDWVATDRAQEELARMDPRARAAAPNPVPLQTLTDAVVELIRNDQLAGRIMVLRPDQPAYLLDPTRDE